MVEGVRDKVYRDTRGKITIGVGFNMDRDEARMEWNEIFGRAVSFDDVYKGDRKLTIEEIERMYRGVCNKLRSNEKITIISLYFNGKSLVGKKTNFYKYDRIIDKLV
jgi:GH24 family phage-related lysozyme (muramidase)